MNNKRYLGAIGMVIGVALTWEAVQEANAMFMLEAILLTIAGTCYVFPVKNFVKKKIETHKVNIRQEETDEYVL